MSKIARNLSSACWTLLFLTALFCCNIIPIFSSKASNSDDSNLLIVHMDMKSRGPVKMLSFCHHCHDPELEGSFLHAIIPKHLTDVESITGSLVYAVPNLVNSRRIYNADAVYGRIVLADRGDIAILEKCLRLKEYDVKGIIIADDGSCTEDFMSCGSRAGGVIDGGFASNDDSTSWLAINIPVLMISLSSAERLRSLMSIKLVNIPPIGMQNVTFRKNKDGIFEDL